MRLNRFYVPAAAPSTVVPLPEDEAAHALRVLRVRQGQAVRVFDGCGHEYAATVGAITRSGVDVMIGEGVAPPSPERRVAVTLVMAVLKGDAMDAVIRDAAMLGVRAVLPLVSGRCETSPAALAKGHRRERWERVAVASVKQCGRAVVPEVLAPVGVDELLARWSTEPTGVRVLAVEPGVERPSARVHDVPAPAAAALVVGPEGGWANDEVDRLSAYARLVRLEGSIFRAESAPVVLLSALLTAWGEL